MWALVSQLEAIHAHAHSDGVEHSATHEEDGVHEDDKHEDDKHEDDDHEEGEHSDEEDHDHAE
jgi:hypothetical protein